MSEALGPDAVVAAAYDDALSRDGELLVLVRAEVVLLSELASALVGYAGDGSTVSTLAARLTDEFGVPEGVNVVETVGTLAAELVERGVLRNVEKTPA